MAMEVDYEKLVAGVPCPKCKKKISLIDPTRTVSAGTFGHVDRKLRLITCPACGEESQFQSEQ